MTNTTNTNNSNDADAQQFQETDDEHIRDMDAAEAVSRRTSTASQEVADNPSDNGKFDFSRTNSNVSSSSKLHGHQVIGEEYLS